MNQEGQGQDKSREVISIGQLNARLQAGLDSSGAEAGVGHLGLRRGTKHSSPGARLNAKQKLEPSPGLKKPSDTKDPGP